MIVHVLNSSGVAGIESLVLPALPHLGWPVRVLFLDEERIGSAGERPLAFARAQGLSAEPIRVRARLDTGALWQLAARLEDLAPIIVHAHDVKASTYALAAARLIPRTRWPLLVSTHHGVAGRPNALAHAYERFYARAILPRYDRVLCCSRADEQNLLRCGVPRDRLLVHWNGVDGVQVLPGERAAMSRKVRGAWGVRESGLILGVVGRLSREKRHDRVLQVAAELDRITRRRDWRILCFGVGALAEKLAEQTHVLDLDHRVHWMGYRADMGREMAGFDVLLSLSDAEGMPLNVIEAGWAATPVAATAVGGVVDLLGNPAAGVLFSPREPPAGIAARIAALLTDEPARADFGSRLQERVLAQFTRAAWLDRLRTIYAPLLEARGVHISPSVTAMENVSPAAGTP